MVVGFGVVFEDLILGVGDDEDFVVVGFVVGWCEDGFCVVVVCIFGEVVVVYEVVEYEVVGVVDDVVGG